MKKIILAAAIVLTTSVLTVIKQDNNIQAPKIAKANISLSKNVLATAD